jgi:hypothetical protein
MGKEWIGNLTQEIKQKNHEAAEDYGREQHRAGIVTAEGRPFFSAFVSSLEEDVNEIRRELQGDVTASETTIQTVHATEIKLARSRFPWFDARITLHDATIALDYAKGLGVAGDPAIDRKTCNFGFRVEEDDTLLIEESFGESPRQFREPGELARYVTELLFKV